MEAVPVGSGGSRSIAAANEEGASWMLFWFHWFLVVSPDLIFDVAWIIDVCLRRRRLSYLSPSASGYAPLSREAAGLLAYSMISTALFTFAGSTMVSLFVLQSPPAWVTANNGLPLAILGWFVLLKESDPVVLRFLFTFLQQDLNLSGGSPAAVVGDKSGAACVAVVELCDVGEVHSMGRGSRHSSVPFRDGSPCGWHPWRLRWSGTPSTGGQSFQLSKDLQLFSCGEGITAKQRFGIRFAARFS